MKLPRPPNRLNQTVAAETVLLLLICLADTGHTLAVVRGGLAHEANPIVAWCLDHSDAMFIAFKVGLTGIFLALIELLRPRYDQFIRTSLQLGIIGYALVYSVATLALVLR